MKQEEDKRALTDAQLFNIQREAIREVLSESGREQHEEYFSKLVSKEGELGTIGQCCMGKPGQEMIEKCRNDLSEAGCKEHEKYFPKLPELKDIDIYGYATEEKVKELREKTGMGKFACKEALMTAKGHMERAIDIMRKKGSLPA